MNFRQFFESESSTYTYLLWNDNHEAIIIDPVDRTFERDCQFLKELGLNLKYIIETHVHADHITSGIQLKKEFPEAKTVVSKVSGATYQDIAVEDGEVLKLGGEEIKVISTPGHTDGCTSFLIGDRLFTGDTLLIRGCGRTDFQQGSPEDLFNNVRNKLFVLPDSTLVFPGHDYKGRCCSSIGEEKKHNPRLGLHKSLVEFKEIMEGLNLAPPKRVEEAVPANMVGGEA